jgi:hypothetical protein
MNNIILPDIEEINKLKEEQEYDYYVHEIGVIMGHLENSVERISEIVKSVNSFSHVASATKIFGKYK